MATNDASAPCGGEDDYLDRDDVCAALTKLTAVELKKLARTEARFRGGTDFGEGDLVQEVFRLAMAGKRKFRRGASVVGVLAGAIRSVASHRRERMLPSISFEASPPTATGEATEGWAPEDLLSKAGDDPEIILLGRSVHETLNAIMDLFDGDDEAQLVIMALFDGLKGADLYEATGLKPNRVHYVIRNIRIRSKECFPGRWTQ